LPLTVCRYKFVCSYRSGLKIPDKILANVSLGEILLCSLLQRAGVFIVRRWFGIGNIKRIVFQGFSQNQSCKKSSITGFAVSIKVGYGKLIIGIYQIQENYRKCLFVVEEKGATVVQCLHYNVFTINKSNAVRVLQS
jgi:hypothetical protein